MTPSPSFVERTDAERGFADLHHRAIAPHLRAFETARLQQAHQLKRRAGAFAGLCAVWLAAALASDGPWLWLAGPSLGAIALFIGRQVAGRPGRDFAEGLRTVILPPLRQFLGGLDHRRDGPLDRFAGQHRGVPFEIVAGPAAADGAPIRREGGHWIAALPLGRPLFEPASWRDSVAATADGDIRRLIALTDQVRRRIESELS